MSTATGLAGNEKIHSKTSGLHQESQRQARKDQGSNPKEGAGLL